MVLTFWVQKQSTSKHRSQESNLPTSNIVDIHINTCAPRTGICKRLSPYNVTIIFIQPPFAKAEPYQRLDIASLRPPKRLPRTRITLPATFTQHSASYFPYLFTLQIFVETDLGLLVPILRVIGSLPNHQVVQNCFRTPYCLYGCDTTAYRVLLSVRASITSATRIEF